MSAALAVVENQPRGVLADMADRYGMHPSAFEATVRATCMPSVKGAVQQATREEFAAFLLVAKEYRLNPLTREIYAFPRKGGGIVPIVSVDGWVTLVNSHDACDGFEFDYEHDDKGKLVSCTCRIFRKDRGRPVGVTEYLAECVRETEPWRMQHRMLRHKALIQAARYAFGFSGIYDEDDGAVIAEARDITPRGDDGPPPAPALPARQPAPVIEHRPAQQHVPAVPAEDAEPTEVLAEQDQSRSASSRSIPDTLDDDAPGFDAEALTAEIEEQYAIATTEALCEEVDDLFAADLDRLSRAQRERVQSAAQDARKRLPRPEAARVATATERQPATIHLPESADPFAPLVSIENARQYGLWLERAIAFTTSPGAAEKLAAAWNGTKEQRRALQINQEVGAMMRETIELKIAEFKVATEPQAAPAGPAVIDINAAPATWPEYVTIAEHVLATHDGIAAHSWWLNSEDARSGVNPLPPQPERSKLKAKFIAARNAAQDAAKAQEG